MTLGEKISALRSKHNMSQGDLAEKINVSRQSISKWETDASVPELDKLVQLSELFNITLDELVKGDATVEIKEEPAPIVIQKGIGTRKLTGLILLCFGLLVILIFTILGSFLGGLLFSSPFLVCSIICLVCKKHTGLWCAWAIFLMVNLYLRFATGITWRLTLWTFNYEPSMNYMRLAFAWIELLCFVAMVTVTVMRFQKKELVLSKRNKILYIAGWILFALLFIPLSPDPLSGLAQIQYLFWDWMKVGLFTALFITTLRLIRTRKKE